jgi:hypothetical protein
MAHKIMASWLAGRDSSSRTARRCLLIQAQGPLHNPAAGQDLEDATIALSHDLDRHLHRTGPGSQLACAVGGRHGSRLRFWRVRGFHGEMSSASRPELAGTLLPPISSARECWPVAGFRISPQTPQSPF